MRSSRVRATNQEGYTFCKRRLTLFPCKILCHAGMAAASTPGNKKTAASPVRILGVEQATHALIGEVLFYSCPTTQPSCQSSRSAHVPRASKANTSNTEKNNSQPTHRTTFSWVTQAHWPYPSPAQCPWAPTADIIVRSVFHRTNFSTKSQKTFFHLLGKILMCVHEVHAMPGFRLSNFATRRQ